jgi:hypothetical protein
MRETEAGGQGGEAVSIRPAPTIVINSPLVGITVQRGLLTIRVGNGCRFYPPRWWT